MSDQMDHAHKCPHCGESFSAEFVSKAHREHTLSFSIEPKRGEKIAAKTLGGTITQMDKFLVAVGEDYETKTAVLIDTIETTEDGTHIVHLLITRAVPGISDD